MDISMAILAPISFIGNGFILIVIISNHNLRKNDGLYLLAALSTADFLLALFILPFVAFLIFGWNLNVNYNAHQMLLFNIPVVCEIKINSVLSVAIAFDRFSAIQWPISYKVKQKGLYACGAVAVGVIWASFDVVVDLSSASFLPNPGCSAAGCFMNNTFRYYWGVSDMAINAVAMAITILLIFKIREIKTIRPGSTTGQFAPNNNNNHVSTIPRSGSLGQFTINNNNNVSTANNSTISNHPSGDAERTKFAHANQIAVSVLLCSGVCIFLPSVFGGVGEMIGLQAFQALGPFVAVGLLACGIGNAFLFGVKHAVIRQAIKAIRAKSNNSNTNEQPRMRAGFA